MQLTDIKIAGRGGQGVALAATIIGKAACTFEEGHATLTQCFRPKPGDLSCAEVILSDEPTNLPAVPRPDVLMLLSQEACQRFAPELKKSGTMLLEEDLVHVEQVPSETRVYGVPAARMAEELGRRGVLNMVMVGFFAAATRLLHPRAFRQAIAESVPEGLREVSLLAFNKGFEYGAFGPDSFPPDVDSDGLQHPYAA